MRITVRFSRLLFLFFGVFIFKHGLLNCLHSRNPFDLHLNNVPTHVYFFICEYIEKVVDFVRGICFLVVVFSTVNICNYQTTQ